MISKPLRRPSKLLALLLPMVLISGAARAGPEADIQRALIERQQRTDELILRFQQSQPSPAPGNLRQQQELDTLHLQQLQRLQNLNAQQLRQFNESQQPSPADPTAAHPPMFQQQQMFDRDRQLELQQFRWEEQRVRDQQQRRLEEKPN